jgi:hypothetical protein
MSSAPEDQEFGNGAQSFGSIAIDLQFGNRFRGKFFGNLVRAFQTEHRWVRRFLLRNVFACGFTQGG